MFRGEQQLEEEGGCCTSDTRSMTHSSHPNASTSLHNWRLLQCFRDVISSAQCSIYERIPEGNVWKVWPGYDMRSCCHNNPTSTDSLQDKAKKAGKFTPQEEQSPWSAWYPKRTLTSSLERWTRCTSKWYSLGRRFYATAGESAVVVTVLTRRSKLCHTRSIRLRCGDEVWSPEHLIYIIFSLINPTYF